MFESAYIKVLYVQGTKDKVEFSIGIYTNKDSLQLIRTQDYVFTPSVDNSSSNFIKQAYEYLKTLSEYEGAIDILDEGQAL